MTRPERRALLEAGAVAETWFIIIPFVTPVLSKQGVETGRQLAEFDLVFSTSPGTPLDPTNVRRAFRRVVAAARPGTRRPGHRESCDSLVSLLSNSGMPIEHIAHLVGHANTRVTELVYRKELRPVLTRGALGPAADGRRVMSSPYAAEAATRRGLAPPSPTSVGRQRLAKPRWALRSREEHLTRPSPSRGFPGHTHGCARP